MKNMKKGFTLIELLAVILILGIIALIAIPTVSKIINDAKEGAFKASIENIKKSIETKCEIEVLKGQNITSTYTFTDGLVSPSLDIKGTLPSSGTITVDDECNVDSINVSNSKYTATLDDDLIKITKDSVGANRVYRSGDLVYFDPVSEEECNEESTTSTCYKWRVIEVDDNSTKENITLQMDHNLINLSAWITKEDYIASGGTEANYGTYGKTDKGPVTALTALNEATTSWVRVNNLTYEYDTTAATNNYGKLICNAGACTINGTSVLGTAKARMITGEEIATITNEKVEDSTAKSKTWTVAGPSSNYFYFSNTGYIMGTQTSVTGTGDITLKWLVENTYKNSNSGATANTYGTNNNGYWTLSPNSGNSYTAWRVGYDGSLYSRYVDYDYSYGVRPVITILKSNL